MKLPLIRNESQTDAPGDVWIFWNITITDQDLGVEAIDVENDEYRLYDGDGCLLVPRIVQEKVVVDRRDCAPEHHNAARACVASWLNHLRPDFKAGVAQEWIDSASLAELIEKAREIEQSSKQPSRLGLFYGRIRALLQRERSGRE